MKKITTIAVVTIFSIAIVSCSKSASSEFTGQESSKLPAPLRPEVNVVSNWISPSSFSAETDRLGNLYIKGVYPFTASSQISYDKSSHIELVYIRIPTNQRVPYKYERLPFRINITANNISAVVQIDYSLDPDGLKLYFKNADYTVLSRTVDLSISDNWNFRYIVIPKTKYQSTNVDWNNLVAVAAALNFSL